MSTLIEGMEGIACCMDDILVYGNTQDEHDEYLLKVLQLLETAGTTVHREFSKTQVNRLLCLCGPYED